MEHDAVHELTAAYALDALDEEDERRYEAHLVRCDRCREELTELSEAAASLAYAVEAPAPPSALRDRILHQARAERTNVVPLRRRWVFPATAAAAVAAACAAVGLGIWAASLHRSLSDERSARARDQRVLAVVSDPQAKRVPLSGDHGTLVVARTGAGALLVSGVEHAARDKTYEAWVITGGKPRPAGLFRGPSSLAVGEVPEGATVAVTLERRGGVQQPTGAVLFSAKSA